MYWSIYLPNYSNKPAQSTSNRRQHLPQNFALPNYFEILKINHFIPKYEPNPKSAWPENNITIHF